MKDMFDHALRHKTQQNRTENNTNCISFDYLYTNTNTTHYYMSYLNILVFFNFQKTCFFIILTNFETFKQTRLLYNTTHLNNTS